VSLRRGKNRHVASAVAGLLTPAGVIALFLALWRMAADLNWTNSFAIPSGLFSHWQVWLGAAGLLQACAHVLNRYAGTGDTAAS
jgi:ABC-type nitrate/sulfonate/bicarbonate transport system permease component